MQQLKQTIHLNLVFLEPKRRGKRLNRAVNIRITTVPFSFVQGDLVVEAEEATGGTLVRISFKGDPVNEFRVEPQPTTTT